MKNFNHSNQAHELVWIRLKVCFIHPCDERQEQINWAILIFTVLSQLITMASEQ